MKQQIFCTFKVYTICYLAALRSEFEIILTFETFLILKKNSFHIFKRHDDFYFCQYFEKEDLLRFVDFSFHCHSRKVFFQRLLLSYSQVRKFNNECITLCPIAQNSSITSKKEIEFLLLLLFVRLAEDSDIKLDAAITMLIVAL